MYLKKASSMKIAIQGVLVYNFGAFLVLASKYKPDGASCS